MNFGEFPGPCALLMTKRNCCGAKLRHIADVWQVSMDRNAPDYILESTEDAKRDAEAFVKFVSDELDDSLITPVVTPRFVPSCSPELMGFLGEISGKYDVPVQSHLSESPGELAWVSQLHPE